MKFKLKTYDNKNIYKILSENKTVIFINRRTDDIDLFSKILQAALGFDHDKCVSLYFKDIISLEIESIEKAKDYLKELSKYKYDINAQLFVNGWFEDENT